MRTLYPVALATLVVSCRLDKLLNGGGGNGPPSEAAPARVAFSSSLSNARAGQPISPPVQVTVQDSAGRVTLRDTLVTLSLAANPSGDSLRGRKQVRSVNGVATFDNVRLDKAASGYRLTAAAPELHPDTSGAFSVMPAPATVLAFTGPPSVTMQDSAMKPVQVTAYDSLGNTATNFAGSVQLRIGTDGSISKKATLSGAVAQAVAGVATFPNLRIDSVGTGYTLTAAFGSAAPVDTSVPFDIIPGPPPPPPPPTHLGFTQQPSQTTEAGATITPPVQVAALDASEHVVQGFTGAIGLALEPASNGGTLSGGTPINAVNGIATFPSLSVDKAGTGYTLRATASGLTDATSSTFNVTPPPNQSPVAAFTASCPTLTCSFTDQSSDPDGTIATWDWDFGDGSTPVTTRNPSHTYSTGGSYTVTLTVTDNQGAPNTVTHSVAPSQPNQPPTAAFTASCPTLTCSFSDQSSDPDGSVTSWQWTFGDGTAGSTAQNPSHTYSAGGSYTVTLTVKDNQNASSSPVSHTVQVTAPNQPPSAAFTSSCTGLACSFSDQSSDPDGSVTSWQWTFGDGTSGSTAQNPSHTYSAGGSYTVTLTVKDNQNASSSPVSHTVQVTAPNQPPSAAFTSSCTGLACSFSDQSSDPDGSVTSWQWTFGDGTSGSTAQNPSHTYSAGGSYTVTLTVKDNQNASSSPVSHTVQVTAPNQPPSVTAGGEQTVLIGALFSLTGAGFSDPNHDGPWTVTINWGDGTSSTSTASSEGSIGGSHSYPLTLLGHDYTLTVTVVDAHGARGSASKTVHVVVA